MARLRWYIDRLKAMNLPEVTWRVKQKIVSRGERLRFSRHQSVTSHPFWETGKDSDFDHTRLGLNFDNSHTSSHKTDIHLLGDYDYADYMFRWHAGFNTSAEWPLLPSDSLNYKQRDDIGDARLNWELNRHHQLALLAREYYVSRDNNVLNTFRKIFRDWNDNNPFLHGISWTSVMEVALRAISQMYALAFLNAAGIEDRQLTRELKISILNCINYVSRHYSRFSSANNHLLVEMTAIGLAGYAFDIPEWKKLAIETLTEQLSRQTFPDGVNREVSLHYHSFALEAYLLMAHVMLASGETLPPSWIPMLDRMSRFLAASMVSDTHAIEFGDNDEGKILDLEGGHNFCHYSYILQLASLILSKKYHSFAVESENISWLFPEYTIRGIKSKEQIDLTQSITFPDGGYSILRSHDNETVVAIDHAPLGFGSIAAHGHDDALSFQLYYRGCPVFGDPGTGVYHCNLPLRNRLRDSLHHNTVTINDTPGAEMLGAFLWGQRPDTSLYISDLTRDLDTVIADTRGLSGISHRRKFTFDKVTPTLIINDEFEHDCDWIATFVLAPTMQKVTLNGNSANINGIFALTATAGHMTVEKGEYSPHYGIITSCHILRIKGHGRENSIIIEPIKP